MLKFFLRKKKLKTFLIPSISILLEAGWILKLNVDIKIELDLSNYVTKADLKNAAIVDTPKFAKIGRFS